MGTQGLVAPSLEDAKANQKVAALSFTVSAPIWKALTASATAVNAAVKDLESAQQRLSALADVNKQFVDALAIGASCDPAKFSKYQLIEQAGKYIVSAQE